MHLVPDLDGDPTSPPHKGEIFHALQETLPIDRTVTYRIGSAK